MTKTKPTADRPAHPEIRCERCGTPARIGARWCRSCRVTVSFYCPACGRLCPPENWGRSGAVKLSEPRLYIPVGTTTFANYQLCASCAKQRDQLHEHAERAQWQRKVENAVRSWHGLAALPPLTDAELQVFECVACGSTYTLVDRARERFEVESHGKVLAGPVCRFCDRRLRHPVDREAMLRNLQTRAHVEGLPRDVLDKLAKVQQ